MSLDDRFWRNDEVLCILFFPRVVLVITLDLNLDENRLTPVHFPRKLVHEKNAIFGPCCRPVNDVANHGRDAVSYDWL